MRRRKAFTKEERQIQIINKLASRNPADFAAPVTASEVANWLDISPTQARNLLDGMVVDEVLDCEFEDYPGICGYRKLYKFSQVYITACTEKRLYAFPPPVRVIKLNGEEIEMEVLE